MVLALEEVSWSLEEIRRDEEDPGVRWKTLQLLGFGVDPATDDSLPPVVVLEP